MSDWNSPVSFKSTCNFDVTYFPYDEHRCEMIFGSLTADKTLIDIRTDEKRLENHKSDRDAKGTEEHDDDDEEFGTPYMYRIMHFLDDSREPKLANHNDLKGEVSHKFDVISKPQKVCLTTGTKK